MIAAKTKMFNKLSFESAFFEIESILGFSNANLFCKVDEKKPWFSADFLSCETVSLVQDCNLK